MGLYSRGLGLAHGDGPTVFGPGIEGTKALRVQIAAHHVHVGERMREVIQERSEHLMRFFDGVTTIHVTVSAEKERRIAEFVANVSGGSQVVAKAVAEGLSVAVHEAAERMETQLRRHKDRIRQHHRAHELRLRCWRGAPLRRNGPL